MLSSIQWSNYPIESGDGSGEFGMAFEPHQSLYQTIGDGFHAVEDPVGKPLLSDFVPKRFHQIQPRAVGRQEEQPHVMGDPQVRRPVPAVEKLPWETLWRVALPPPWTGNTHR